MMSETRLEGMNAAGVMSPKLAPLGSELQPRSKPDTRKFIRIYYICTVTSQHPTTPLESTHNSASIIVLVLESDFRIIGFGVV